MGTFQASLRAIGDVRGVPATVELEDGRLSIAAGDTEIGSWSLGDIELEPIPTGYRLAAEGDQILIELKDTDSFTEELHEKKRRKSRREKAPKPARARPSEGKVRKPKVERPERARRERAPRGKAPVKVVTAARETTVTTVPPPASGDVAPQEGFLAKVDGFLDRSNERFGDRLPGWVFTRGMLALALVVLVTLVVAPGLISALLLVAGLLMVLLGAVLYTDAILAVRFLRGNMTPTRLLIIGVATVLVGVIVGTISR